MSEFYIYMTLGFDHISDLRGFDHLLFIITLCCAYSWLAWRKIGILITAFTLGHSITLALSAFGLILFNTNLIEILIASTILITAIANIYLISYPALMQNKSHYILALVFGFIHGMGFSIFFKSLLPDSMDLILPLFAFNIGLETGQLLIVLLYFIFYYLFTKTIHVQAATWTKIFSVTSAFLSLLMIIQMLLELH